MSKTTVLIVEDEAIVAADLAGKLRMLGYEIVGTAAEGEKAIDLACSLKPEVVLMDIRLKGPMDGIEAAEAITRSHCAPVIYLTAHSDAVTLARAKLSGPFGYILKPFEERELSTTIEMALFKHQSEQQLRTAHDELEIRVEERTRELRVASAYNRSLIEASVDPLVTIGYDGRITDVNAATEAMTGSSRTELIGTDFCDYFGEPEKARVGYQQVFRDGSVRDYPLELRHRDGSRTPVLYNASVYCDEQGKTIGVFAAARDITEQKKAQAALQELNDTLEEQVIERTAQLKSANETLRASRVAALNLMEDAVNARREAEKTALALQESEERVRLKLESILTPEGDIGNLDLADIMDLRQFQSLMDDFYALAHIPMALIDLKGKVLVGVGWQEICTKYYRQHPETLKHCIESDTRLTSGIPEGEYRLYKCMNNMWDAATPVMVGGKHLALLFTGQFFFDDELPDYEVFRSQADRYGYPEADYMAALMAVPRVSRVSIDTAMAYLMKLAAMISRLSYSNIKLAHILAERESLMQSLKESEHFYSQTLESIPGMVFTTRPDGYCDYQSMQWVEFTGVPMNEHLGDGWNRLLHPDDRPRAFDAWRTAVEGRAPYDLEYRVQRHDGEYEWFKVIGRPIRDAAGEIVKWFGVAVNIDANKRAEEELHQAKEAAEAASRAKSQFLANMSHELRTPMSGVLGMLEHTLSTSLDEQQRECIFTADKSARSLLRIINDILDLTKIEAGKLTIEEKPFELAGCVAGAVDILIPEARRKGLDLVRSFADDLPQSVIGDQVRLRQILTNLIGNAVKFTGEGRVEVRVEARKGTAAGRREFTFTVADTGIGIPADKQHLLFNSFSQVDNSDTRVYGGTGLGLAISREIVERMGGTISCTSEEGRGSSFSFTLTLGLAGEESGAIAEPVNGEPLAGAVPGSDGDGRTRLLIAEDDEITRKVLSLMLKQFNFELDFVTDGWQAVEMWEKGGYDLIIMDGQMPVMDGFAATGTIRARERERGGHIPIVAMTAHALKEDHERCLAAGMDAYVSKRINFKNCIEVIRGLLEKGENKA